MRSGEAANPNRAAITMTVTHAEHRLIVAIPLAAVPDLVLKTQAQPTGCCCYRIVTTPDGLATVMRGIHI